MTLPRFYTSYAGEVEGGLNNVQTMTIGSFVPENEYCRAFRVKHGIEADNITSTDPEASRPKRPLRSNDLQDPKWFTTRKPGGPTAHSLVGQFRETLLSCFEEAYECDSNHAALQDGGKIHQALEDVNRVIQSGLEEIKRQRAEASRETPTVPGGVAPVRAHPSGSAKVQTNLEPRKLECVECGTSAFANGLNKPHCQRSVICPICGEWVHSCGTEQKMLTKWTVSYTHLTLPTKA